MANNVDDSSKSSPTEVESSHVEERLAIWENLHSQQDTLYRGTVNENVLLHKRVKDLEQELRIWKVGVKHSERENEDLSAQVARLQGSLNAIQNDNPLVACLIDGDGVIFSEDLLIRGREGGREAAAQLTQAIRAHLTREPSSSQPPLHSYSIYTAIYYNGPGLTNTLVQNKVCDAKDFSDFVNGFNQATPLFTFVDVGSGKEAADAKLRESLKMFIKFPQTRYVLFGGAHDQGYMNTLHSVRTDGLLHKLIVLKGHTKIARDVEAYIDEMSIEIIEPPDLFLKLKLTSKQRPTSSTCLPGLMDAGRVSPSKNQRLISKSKKTNRTVNQNDSEEGSETPSIVSQKQFRQLDPTKPLSKQSPAPCNSYYLAVCYREYCPFGHDYDLSLVQVEELRQNLKKAIPCADVNQDKPCLSGNACIFGHVCPEGPRCWFFKQGKCRFKGQYMHIDITSGQIPETRVLEL